MISRILVFSLCLISLSLFGSERPNVVLIIGDDISPDFSCFGGPVNTPHIDALAEGGVRFENAYVTASSCSPSRCSMITGRYPHNTGAPELHMDLPNGQFLFPKALKDAGYFTAQYGKLHMGEYAKEAFDVVQGVSYAEDYTGAEGWVQLLRDRPADQPFMMWFAAYDAHRPWEPDPGETPHQLARIVLPAGVPDTPVARQDVASYYDEVRRFDRYVGGVVTELKRQDVFDETVIILLGDNGRPFPRNKTTLYEGGMRTPLIVHWPKGRLASGATSDSLISTIDLAPTILEIASLPIPGSIQGINMLPVCRQPGLEIREVLFGEQNWHVQRYCARMVRKGDFVYFRDFAPHLPHLYPGGKEGAVGELTRLYRLGELTKEQALIFSDDRPEESLFNLKEDPNQLHNLAEWPEHENVLLEMRELLATWQDETGDSIPSVDEMTPDRNDPVTGKRLYPGWRPPTGEVPGAKADATSILGSQGH